MIKNKIQICNWLLTRRCNLRCEYCAIVREPTFNGYPDINHYIKNEMKTDFVLDVLGRLKKHNPDCFHIFYGGEPLLRNDLATIIKFCHENEIYYTIITNNTGSVINNRIQRLIDEVGPLEGLTSSIDPILLSQNLKEYGDRGKKSVDGFKNLVALKSNVKDLVAEITITNDCLDYIVPLVRILSAVDITSSITFIDVAKNKFYDFSTVTDENLLIGQSKKVETILKTLIDENLKVHMGELLLDKIYDILPSNMKCDIEHHPHNLTIDADGSVRLCLRARGILTPREKVTAYLDKDGFLNDYDLSRRFLLDKKIIDCKKCNWTCVLMSDMLDKKEKIQSELIHLDRRK